MGETLDFKDSIEVPEGLRFLVSGYADYAKEVVTDRAIANIDGFKPSQRRILYTMKAVEKVKDLIKSSSVVGSTLKLHPHGDAAVYDTMVRMVDSTLRARVPFIAGKGDFGRLYSTEPPAAMRYTEVAFTSMADELFNEMDGINMVSTEDGHYKEPEVLPVSFPTILNQVQTGIAVGVASNYPSFNFNELNDATIELIETGDIKGVLIPDFTSKGFYVHNEKELRKIMETGKGKLKLRGKWFIEGKTIVIEEIPYYTTSTAIMDKLKKVDIQGVSDVRDETDFDGLRIAIECSNRKIVDQVLTEVLRVTDLQTSISTNIVVIIDNKPRVLGVKELLKEWVKFRTGILSKQLKIDYDKTLTSIAQYTVFADLINDEDKRTSFTETLAKQGALKARDLLVNWFPQSEQFVFDWILDMKIRQFSRNSDVMSRLEGYKRRKAEIEVNLNDVPRVIVNQLKELNRKYKFPRLTQVTDEDYVFDKSDNTVVKAEAVPVIVQIDGKFMKKIRINRATQNLEGLRCMSDDVLSFIDSQGRLLRVALENIDFSSERERGIYLPVYLEVEDDFEVVSYELIQDKKVGYVFSDGFASVVDYSEWVDSKRTTRITTNGVSPLSSLIIGEIDFTKNYLLMFTRSGKFGFASTEFKHKHRTARTKLVPIKEEDEIVTVISLTYTDILKLVSSPEKYMGKMSLLAYGDTFNSEYLDTLI